jgi:hypothetical protein
MTQIRQNRKIKLQFDRGHSISYRNRFVSITSSTETNSRRYRSQHGNSSGVSLSLWPSMFLTTSTLTGRSCVVLSILFISYKRSSCQNMMADVCLHTRKQTPFIRNGGSFVSIIHRDSELQYDTEGCCWGDYLDQKIKISLFLSSSTTYRLNVFD